MSITIQRDGVRMEFEGTEEEFYQHSFYLNKNWKIAGPLPEPEPPTEAKIIADIILELEAYYDEVAARKSYGAPPVPPRVMCALRAGYPGPFQAEGIAFGAWMDECNAYAYQVQADVKAGLRGIPTGPELIAELPPVPVGFEPPAEQTIEPPSV